MRKMATRWENIQISHNIDIALAYIAGAGTVLVVYTFLQLAGA